MVEVTVLKILLKIAPKCPFGAGRSASFGKCPNIRGIFLRDVGAQFVKRCIEWEQCPVHTVELTGSIRERA